MMFRTKLGWAGVGAALLVTFFGCYTGPHVDLPDRTPSEAPADVALSAEAGVASAGATAGLPCDVAALLAARCTSCHSDPPSTAPMALVTHAQLTAPSTSDPSMTVAQLAVKRMHDASKPMPPSNVLPAADLAVFGSWVEAGAPALGCVPDEIASPISDAGGPECVLASDCPGELVCRNARCDVECVKDKDCVPTWTCKSTRCQPPPATGSSSAADSGASSSNTTVFRDFTSSTSWSTSEVSLLAGGLYNGTTFDGRYVYFAPDGTNGKVLRFDTEQAFGSTAAWSSFDLTTIDPRAMGYRGAVSDGRYVYLIPASPGLLAARFDTHATFGSAASWTLFSLKDLSPLVSSFAGATFDGRYVYLVPAFGTRSIAVRLDTHAEFASASAWTIFSIATVDPKAISFAGAVYDGRYVYLVPWRGDTTGSGLIARFDPEGGFADPASWKTFDIATLNAGANGYRGAAFDGRYIYLVPGWTAPTPSWSSTTLARFDTQVDFALPGAWTFFDMATLGPEAGGFNAAVFDGRYLFFAPGYGANIGTGTYRGDAFRFDTLAPFTQASAWSRFDTKKEIATSLVNTKGAAFDGRYVYLAPSGGVAARFDSRTPRGVPALPAFHGSFY